ncbi:MAG: hypothetical protein ABJM06_13935 [Gilvibacter sp.]
MKIYTSLFFMLFICTAMVAQSDYLPGHYINSANQKVTGFIKNEDWKASPNSIQFKATAQGNRQTISIGQMNGFSITGVDAYVKRTFELDVSTDNLNNLTYSKEPVFETRTGMLKELASGAASLYYYEKEGIKEYFYSKGDTEFEPLVHVRYLVGDKVTSNDRYKQQLLNALNDCAKLTESDFVKLNYKRSALTKIFDKYNGCNDASYNSRIGSGTSTSFNLNLYAGANFSNFSLTNDLSATRGGDFGSNTALRFGVELEAILPFNNGSWAVFTGLAKNTAYESTIVQQLSSANTPEQNVTLTYSSINIPIGVRYYIAAGDASRVSLNLGYMFDVVSEISLEREVTANDFENSTGTQGLLFVGAGFHYKQFFVKANLDIGKDPFKANSSFYNSDLSSFNLVVGYSIDLSKK